MKCRKRSAHCACCRWPSADLPLGRGRRGFIPVIVLAIAMLLVALHVVPVAIAFFGAAAVIVLLKAISLREAYDAVEWPILVMLGALIPLSRLAAHHRWHRRDRRLADGRGRQRCRRSARWR